MDLIPFSKVRIISNLTENEILSRITENTTNPLGKRFVDKPTKKFEGYIYENSFKITRAYYNSRNPFLPIFNGIVNSENGKSIITIKIAAHIVALISLLIALVIMGIVTNGFYYLESGINQYFFLIPLAIYGLLTYSYNTIKKEYLNKIMKVIEGTNLTES